MGNYYKKGNGDSLNPLAAAKEREDKVFSLYAEMLIEKIETSAKSKWEKPWFTEGQLSVPKSVYGKSYHGMNLLMLTLLSEKEGYKIPVFGTGDHFYSLNYQKDKDGRRIAAVDDSGNKLPFLHILKGEHSFPVFLTMVNVVNKETSEKIKWSDYVKLSSEEQKDYSIYHNRRVYPVFNVDQTNMREARPELYQKLMDEHVPRKPDVAGPVFSFEPLDRMVSDNLWICPIRPVYGDNAYYSISKNEIVIPEKAQFVRNGKGEAYFGTMLHEMIHSTGAESQLNRLKPGEHFGSAEYAREELVAELGSAICCLRYGLGKFIKEDTIPYVQSWLGALHENPDYIRSVLKDVKMATSVVDVHVEQVRERCLGERDSERLDVREEDESTLEYDESGDAHLGQGSTLGADRKQGDGEGLSRDVTAQEEPVGHRHGGIRF